MTVKVFTDASFSVKNRKSGYAFAILYDNGHLLKADAIKCECASTDEAEMMAAGNAIYLLRTINLFGVKNVHVFLDSKPALNGLKGRRFVSDRRNQLANKIKLYMMEFCMSQGYQPGDTKKMFHFHHVKAHTGKTTLPARANRWCDKNAKLYSK